MTFPVFASGDVLNASDMNAVGLWLIASGSPSAASSVNVDNVLTADYRNYVLHISGTTTTTANINLQFRVGGVTATGANYYWAYLANGAATSASRSTGNTSFLLGTLDNNLNNSIRCDIFSPAVAVRTSLIADNQFADTNLLPDRQAQTGAHDLATAYDGIALSTSSGTWTGNYYLYGYRA